MRNEMKRGEIREKIIVLSTSTGKNNKEYEIAGAKDEMEIEFVSSSIIVYFLVIV